MAGGWTPLPDEVPESSRALLTELRRLKDRSGLNLVQLGRRTNYSKSSWERWLNGKSPVPSRAVAGLAAACGEDPARLLDLWERANQEQDARPDPDPGTAPVAAPAPDGGRLSRALRRKLAVELGTALAVGAAALAVFAGYRAFTPDEPGPDPQAGGASAGAGTPGTGVAARAGCREDGCERRDPKQAGCDVDAETLTTAADRTMTVHLRYSRSCRAAWGKITDAKTGDVVTVHSAGGASASQPIRFGYDVYTTMIGAPDRSAIWSCGATAEARVCTEKQVPAPR